MSVWCCVCSEGAAGAGAATGGAGGGAGGAAGATGATGAAGVEDGEAPHWCWSSFVPKREPARRTRRQGRIYLGDIFLLRRSRDRSSSDNISGS